MRTALLDTLVSLLVLLLQTGVAPILGVGHVVPDFLLVWIAILGLRHGRFAATGAGFLLGLLVDLISGSDGMLGLSAFCKSIAGFVAGSFYNENKTARSLGGRTLLVAVATAALVHNLVYFVIFLQGAEVGFGEAVLVYALPAAAYTAAVALLPMFVYGRRKGA